ncbi:endonuclease MutS2 [Tenuibacillus multivorans]|uniref:Endonuclease MutS2 n=1 Tax=Tenuibacillus multivorans TaxID=237069 RepID=A0A1G9ZQX4_9BACI|nr:endonuclease MutS2 [Tenuibacillus multivorans]GEL76812.1 endonuclease MutS2 [Tenuibacillus multivorans]SDN23525.1 DNA mismatch repair protein MutS2 [Tenuibacillus multivorans]
MNDKILHQLEFSKIKDWLKGQAATSLGQEKSKKILPSSDLEEVIEWQNETDEAVTILRLKGHIPLGGITDIRPAIKRASIGGVLSASELLDIANTLYGGKQLKSFIEDLEDIELPIIREYMEQLTPLNQMEQSIKGCIDDYGHVMDGASSKLRTIRSQIRSYESSIRDKLDQYTKSKSNMLSDAIVTIRNDRYVLPVKHEYRSSFGGIVHDQSSSGQTLFIEPQSVVELNNKLQEARVEEEREIERILLQLSGLVQADADILRHNVTVLQQMDFIVAKGKLSRHLKAAKPTMNQEGYINMRQARHPLIPEDEIISNDVEIGKDYTAIVITGPNTGGKTVTLKMVGLCTLMAQSGLQVPAQDGCELAVFDYVFADIGDEQSIEQSLSTFSSHMSNIVEILNDVNSNSLVLFDELGAGTDPQEGAGLAMAILDYVVEKRSRVIATTHYPELKAYGFNRKEVINASVEFDITTLKPTYRLLLGVPGRSNAFDISKRLGLEELVIDRAKSMVSDDSRSVENMIASLEQSRLQAERHFEEAEDFLEEATNIYQSLRNEYEHYLSHKEKHMDKAKVKAAKIVDRAETEAEEILKEIREMRDEANVKEHRFIDAKKKLSNQKESLETTEEKPQKKAAKNQSFMPGDEVHVLSFNQNGNIVEKINDKEYEVQLGILKMKVPVNQLEFIKRPDPLKTKPMTSVKGSHYHVKPELDLRGERYEDALQRLEKYIDEALLANYHQVSIIHGKGTGALMKAVQQFAKEHRAIKGSRSGHANEGGSGVTVLELK